jgi:maltose alpha-D-glucosyltransferase/alpha-amylase
MRLRGHGDLQLSQVLYTGKDFVLIGFDGEPGRAGSESRLKRSPLRDVASMLRSFHYANRVALKERAVRPEDLPHLEPWARFWNIWVAVAFLRTYLSVTGDAPFLPETYEDRVGLLYFYLIKRAANELRYELSMNPERVTVPLHGLHGLLSIQ